MRLSAVVLREVMSGTAADRVGARLRAHGSGSEQPSEVAEVFRVVLGRPEVGPDDTFVSLGGDSLSYVEASLRLESVLGRLPQEWQTLPVRTLERLGTGTADAHRDVDGRGGPGHGWPR